MKVRHVALFVWRDDATPEQLAAVATGLDALRRTVPRIAAFHHGPDLAINDGNADYAVVADFETEDDYLAYRDHPAHQAFLADVIRPILASRTAVQLELASFRRGLASSAPRPPRAG